MLGEPGTEQFNITTSVDGEQIRSQPIHDPFLHNRTVIRLSRWQALKHFFRPRDIVVTIHVHGTQAVQRAIMTLDADELASEEKNILLERELQRQNSWTGVNRVAEG